MVLFLTGCIDPHGMTYTVLENPDIRRQQYIDAISWYLENTTIPILFVENSGNDISSEFSSYVNYKRLEILTFNGNDFDNNLGKGYGEARIMQYGFEHSWMLQQQDTSIIKITGRFICRNINNVVRRYHTHQTVYSDISKDDWGGNISSSGFIIAPSAFWTKFFLPRREELNDSKRFHFEHLLYESIYNWTKEGMRHREFWITPQMEGISGTSGKHSISSDHRDFKSKLLYILHRFGYRGYLNPFYHGNPNHVINGSYSFYYNT